MAGRAVILAAGKSSKFFPPLYDRPKGLFKFRGEVLVERQIRQLVEADVDDITVVIGYEKERFFYLEDRFPVRLVVSTRYNDESNISSLDLVRDRLGGSFVCCADHWYEDNPFVGERPSCSTRLVREGAGRGIPVVVGNDGRLFGGTSGDDLGMVGWAYLDEAFVRAFFDIYDREKDRPGVKSMLWEQLWSAHSGELPIWPMEAPRGFVEFDSLSDLQRHDAGVLENVAADALANICDLLGCGRDDVRSIEPLNKGLTNVSFTFEVGGCKYVYRHPGASSSVMVNRRAEVAAQREAVRLGLDPSVIEISESGWKLSRFVDAARDFDYEDWELVDAAVSQLVQFQRSGVDLGYEVDLLAEGDRLLGLAASKKPDAAAGLIPVRAALQRLWHHFELDGWPKVPCHNDAYAVNWIVGRQDLCLIDWEYAGMNDGVNDVATLVVRDGLNRSTADMLLESYFGDIPDAGQRCHSYACFALCAWYWYCWSLFKDTLGEDGFFMLPAWRALREYLPVALEMYGDGGVEW